jgi:hypothetical protein
LGGEGVWPEMMTAGLATGISPLLGLLHPSVPHHRHQLFVSNKLKKAYQYVLVQIHKQSSPLYIKNLSDLFYSIFVGGDKMFKVLACGRSVY